jgi:hypothetical protein
VVEVAAAVDPVVEVDDGVVSVAVDVVAGGGD